MCTPLSDQRVLKVLHRIRGRANPLVVVETATGAPTVEPGDTTAELALRLWRADRDAMRFALTERGIAVVTHRPGEPLDLPLVPLLRTASRREADERRRGDLLAARCLGTTLAVAACDPPAALHSTGAAKAAVVVVAGAAWAAAPMTDERPLKSALRWPAVALRRRSTLLAAAAVVIAALTAPPVWLAARVTALLLACLLVTDAWTAAVSAPPGPRPRGPALIAAAACPVVFLAARAPVAGTSWSRLPAALAVGRPRSAWPCGGAD
ncbi:hypothetical protein [Actinacidiphila sp. ITFR-21]|uniref:hypothetical protein n=1 Tax=Actinacidiphila sp. ITFR-21 TaxID=3075199 RepID=UPI00288C4E8B|nr:hypothetical protein [Streptomyces sp. ITFR-21]WNI14162.1 hypothetical protein RLT57_00540 [Streptomyces sp. ITFR-21]